MMEGDEERWFLVLCIQHTSQKQPSHEIYTADSTLELVLVELIVEYLPKL